MEELSKESIVGRLKEEGLKITPQRLAVIETLVEKRGLHPGAALIYEEARKKRKGLSLSTTYATLETLSRLGIIKALEFDGMENRYEGNLGEHVNLICRGCGKITDHRVPAALNREEVARETGFVIADSRFEYYGYCPECREARKEDTKRTDST